MAMLALRGIRRLSTAAPRKEYPSSFIAHLRTQKLNVFNIGVVFLTLSLSSQMVSYKQSYESMRDEKEKLDDQVEVLEKLVLSLGGVLPHEETLAKETEALMLRDREKEAQAVAALAMDDKKSKLSKLI